MIHPDSHPEYSYQKRGENFILNGDDHSTFDTVSSLQVGAGRQNKLQNLAFLADLFAENVFLSTPYHNEFFAETAVNDNDSMTGFIKDSNWRLKDRMKISAAALVVCLNIGTDPPDIIKPNPCARRECWMEPMLPKQKGLEAIGNALQLQYEKLQSKIKYKPCLDPTAEDLRRVCVNLRKNAKSDRLLFHYNGHGVPRPTKNGEIWLFGKHYTHYLPVPIHDIRSWLGDPAIYVFDCSAAGILISHIIDCNQFQSNETINASKAQQNPSESYHHFPEKSQSPPNRNLSPHQLGSVLNSSNQMEGQSIILAACKANEIIPMHPQYPADLFTSCLTTPISIALRWLILQNPYSLGDVSLELSENLPGKEGDRKTPRGELYWIFTAITDTIAWSALPPATFQRIFRQDMLVSSLFRHFLLAKRIMRSFNCTAQSWPVLPNTTGHHLWQAWDLAAESCLLHVVAMIKGSPMVDARNNIPFASLNIPTPNLPFFSEQLTSFEIWLDFGLKNGEIPMYLPVVLQVLLSQTHRLKALLLLKRYLSLGPAAVNSTLLVGICPYILKLLQSPAAEIRQILVCIWAHIIGFDPSCRQELIRDKAQGYFMQYLTSRELAPAHRCLAAFILAEICNHHPDGQQTCLQQGLHRSCIMILSQPEVTTSGSLKLWSCLCVAKLCEDFIWAKYLCITESLNSQLYPLLMDADPLNRVAAVLALGEMFGASSLSHLPPQDIGSFGTLVDPRELRESELQLALQLLECCTEASLKVRRETIISLSKFIILPAHLPCFIIILSVLGKLGVKGGSQTNDVSSIPSSSPPVSSSALLGHSVGLPNVSSAINLTSQSGSFSSRTSYTNRETTEKATISSSPSLHTGSLNSSAEGMAGGIDYIWPWSITSAQTAALVDEVKVYLESQGIGITPPGSPFTNLQSKTASASKGPNVDFGVGHNYLNAGIDGTFPSPESIRKVESFTGKTVKLTTYPVIPDSPSTPNFSKTNINSGNPFGGASDEAANDLDSSIAVSSMMAAAYVKFWLALCEVQRKDPHVSIVASVSTIFKRLNEEVIKEDARLAAARTLKEQYSRSNPEFSTFATSSSSSSSSSKLNSNLSSSFEVTQGDYFLSQGQGGNPYNAPPLSPLGIGARISPRRLPSQGGTPTRAQFFGRVGAVPPFPPSIPSNDSANLYPSGNGILQDNNSLLGGGLPPRRMGSFGEVNEAHQGGGSVPLKLGFSSYGSSQDVNKHLNTMESIPEDSMVNHSSHETDPEPILISHFYDWTKRSYLNPDDGFASNDDVLSLGGNNKAYREMKAQEIKNAALRLINLYKVLDDSAEYQINDKKSKEELQLQRATAIAALPQSIVKFEQKTILNIDNAKLTSLVTFHSHQDILATSDGQTVRLWSLASGNKFMDLKNTHNHHGSLAHNNYANPGQEFTGSSGNSRITSMLWINESCDSLLGVGSDNGIVNIWRDISETDYQGIATGQKTMFSSLYSSTPSTTISAVSGFAALPDIVDTSRGSGLIMSWLQETGMLVVGGNSPTIRIWDMNREQCVRVFSTGVDTCTTALIAKPLSSSFFSSSDNRAISHKALTAQFPSKPETWTFAGFADGTVSIFDERLSGSSSGRVLSGRADSGSWIVAGYTRHDLPQVITAAIKGTVRFWDIRTMRVYKTLEVFKHPLTALAVHRCLPIMATGSHAQIIKIFTMGGDQLGNDIKYHDGFLGQRIGPISCLAFHPHKMMIAAGATDNIVSIYAPPDA